MLRAGPARCCLVVSVVMFLSGFSGAGDLNVLILLFFTTTCPEWKHFEQFIFVQSGKIVFSEFVKDLLCVL